MKVRTRTQPCDTLSFEQKGYRVYVATSGQREIHVRIHKDGKLVHGQEFTPEQFISLLMCGIHTHE